MQYKSEIDGLRAFAVISVLLFHSKLNIFDNTLFKGGYIGVDIFFVISGYLIFNIIISEVDRNKSFDFLNFFNRRARRILPMLLFIMIICFPFAWNKFFPENLKEFSESSLYALASLSNFFFYFETIDYYSSQAFLKPLLHTWSLSVEVQFYIFFSILLFFLYKFFSKSILIIILIFSFLSIYLSEIMSSQNANLNFYLPLTRSWEFLFGSILALANCKYNFNKYSNLTFPSLLGFFLIAFSIFFFNANTPHPGYLTIIPIFGTGLVILFSSNKNITGKILSSKPLVFLGLISYSIYLWHYPVFSFFVDDVYKYSNFKKLFLIFIVFFLSILSYFFIEKTFRSKNKISNFNSIIALTISIFFIVAANYFIIKTSGAKFYELKDSPMLKYNKNNKKTIALIGDSHAKQLNYGLNVLSDGKIEDMTGPGCIPFRNIDRYDFRYKPGDCAKHTNKSLNKIIASKEIDTVIMGTMGPVYLDNTAFQNQDEDRIKKQKVIDLENKNLINRYTIFKIGFERTIKELIENKKKIVFVFDNPELGKQYHNCLSSNKTIKWRPFGPYVKMNIVDKEKCFFDRKLYDSRIINYKKMIDELKKIYTNVIFVDPTLLFCNQKKCLGYREDKILYKDPDHLNNYGSLIIARMIWSHLN